MNAAFFTPVHDVHLRLAFRSGACDRCYPAFTSWHDDARAGVLRPSIVGGVPIETSDPEVTAEQVPLGSAVSSAPLALEPARAG